MARFVLGTKATPRAAGAACRQLHNTGKRMKLLGSFIAAGLLSVASIAGAQTYLGNLSSNPYATQATGNPYGAGNPYATNSVNNPYGPYGNPYSNRSATNPYATAAPRLYDSQGNYRGRLSSNPYDPDSISNPYGRYGNPYSSDSINNPYGAGNPYSSDSPNNAYGQGLIIIGDDGGDF